ncbi:uncharacterized protein LOC142980558 [Anticarsia gemmatalis]|uniref:uncharacterized protein LOC142980558 n=1 Tax=Anticarsia gemmatalis TaxID=129554 RepID=UPI003F7733CB
MVNQEKLIELVKHYPLIYDLNNRFYSDNQKKLDAWKEIAKILHARDGDCKKTWALLRDSYRRAIKKQKEASNEPGSTLRKRWKYESEMSFLQPYLKERPTNNTTYDNDDKYSDTEGNGSDVDIKPGAPSPEAIIAHFTHPPEWSFVTDPSVASTSQNIDPISAHHYVPVQRRPKYRRQLVRQPKGVLTSALVKFLLEKKAKNDDVQQFFDSIATTVQSFPPRDRVIAKAKVFQVISEMEMEILGRDVITTDTDQIEQCEDRISTDLESEDVIKIKAETDETIA